MNFEISGKLIEKYNTVQVSEKFRKREFVVECADNNFTNYIKFQIVQDRTDLLDAYNLGEQVKISFDIKGNKWKDAYFVNLQAWKLEKVGQESQTVTVKNEAPPPSINDLPAAGIVDDLPF